MRQVLLSGQFYVFDKVSLECLLMMICPVLLSCSFSLKSDIPSVHYIITFFIGCLE